jgi:hypothetical protein
MHKTITLSAMTGKIRLPVSIIGVLILSICFFPADRNGATTQAGFGEKELTVSAR